MLTPVTTWFPTPDGDRLDWGYAQSFQAGWFDNFTTKEVRCPALKSCCFNVDTSQLSDIGAFDPNLVLPRPDSRGNLHE